MAQKRPDVMSLFENSASQAEVPSEAFGVGNGPSVIGQPVNPQAPSVYLARVPQEDPNYVFSKENYLSWRSWWMLGDGQPLYISGPAGCGKTSSVLQWGAILRQPVVTITARPRMDKRELLGRWVMKEKGMEWVDGPATLVWKFGGILLINEFSAAPAEMWVSANDLLEGLALEIDQLGVVIERHPSARVVITDNTRGHTSEVESGFLGRQLQDRSVIDRCWHLHYEGLEESVELELMKKRLGIDYCKARTWALARGVDKEFDEFFSGLTHFAQLTRSEVSENIGFSSPAFPISHRTLIRLGKILMNYVLSADKEQKDALSYALNLSIGAALDSSVRAALEQSLKTVVGLTFDRVIKAKFRG